MNERELPTEPGSVVRAHVNGITHVLTCWADGTWRAPQIARAAPDTFTAGLVADSHWVELVPRSSEPTFEVVEETRPCLCGKPGGEDGWCPVHGGALAREMTLGNHVVRLGNVPKDSSVPSAARIRQMIEETRQAHLNVNSGKVMTSNLVTTGGIAALDMVLDQIRAEERE